MVRASVNFFVWFFFAELVVANLFCKPSQSTASTSIFALIPWHYYPKKLKICFFLFLGSIFVCTFEAIDAQKLRHLLSICW
jgi:hypothetical protein